MPSNSTSSSPGSPSKSILKKAKSSESPSTDEKLPPVGISDSPKRGVKWSEQLDIVKTYSCDEYQRGTVDLPTSPRRVLLRPLAARFGVDIDQEDWYEHRTCIFLYQIIIFLMYFITLSSCCLEAMRISPVGRTCQHSRLLRPRHTLAP